MRGSCLCGAVAFEVDGPLRPVIVCHCSQCRKTSGHFWSATAAPQAQVRMQQDRGLVWFASSAKAQRGFCRDCGASLFWQPFGDKYLYFAPGCLEGPTGLAVAETWHEEDAGDYYAVSGPATGSDARPETLHAACLCGGNQFSLPGPMGEVTACHCSQCRKLSGHFAASFDAEEADLVWQARQVKEYVTPGGGQRGFCTGCGSSLYFRAADGRFSIEAGSVEKPTGGRLSGHIFVADKGDYYQIEDGLPQD